MWSLSYNVILILFITKLAKIVKKINPSSISVDMCYTAVRARYAQWSPRNSHCRINCFAQLTANLVWNKVYYCFNFIHSNFIYFLTFDSHTFKNNVILIDIISFCMCEIKKKFIIQILAVLFCWFHCPDISQFMFLIVLKVEMTWKELKRTLWFQLSTYHNTNIDSKKGFDR